MGLKIKFILALVLSIALTILLTINILPSTTNVDVSLQGINFTLNNTNYALQGQAYSSNPYVPILYYFSNTTFPLPSANYLFSGNQVRIYTNSTAGGYPNITNNSIYYATYTYYRESWIGGSNYSWIVPMVLFIGLFAVILTFLMAI